MSLDKDIARAEKRLQILKINPKVGQRIHVQYDGLKHVAEIVSIQQHQIKIKFVELPFYFGGIKFCFPFDPLIHLS